MCAHLVSPARADTPTRPTVAVIPADQRIPRLSKDARAAIDEIHGKARGSRLADLFSAAERRGDLRRWALELQSVVHPENGDYLFKLPMRMPILMRMRMRISMPRPEPRGRAALTVSSWFHASTR